MATYNHKEIEKKWQAYWADNHTFKTGTDADRRILVRTCQFFMAIADDTHKKGAPHPSYSGCGGTLCMHFNDGTAGGR